MHAEFRRGVFRPSGYPSSTRSKLRLLRNFLARPSSSIACLPNRDEFGSPSHSLLSTVASRAAPKIARILVQQCGEDRFGHVVANHEVAVRRSEVAAVSRHVLTERAVRIRQLASAQYGSLKRGIPTLPRWPFRASFRCGRPAARLNLKLRQRVRNSLLVLRKLHTFSNEQRYFDLAGFG